MMGRLNHDQGQLFYSFCIEEVVPDDHLVREIASVLDLSWIHAELAPHYPNISTPREFIISGVCTGRARGCWEARRGAQNSRPIRR
jgi:hypothetical protein